MQKRLLLDSSLLDRMISRLCQQLIENHATFTDTVLLGLQPRGIFLAERLRQRLESELSLPVPIGHLDATFYRDDFRHRNTPLQPNATWVPFLIENKRVILIDDVLFTGRTVRAALDAMTAFGRPRQVELLALIDRKYTRELPIQADYIGTGVDSVLSQRILVEWREQGATEDAIWLVN